MRIPRSDHKLLVVNRGEIAVRIINAASDLGLRTIALASEVDRDALHASMADEVIGLIGNRAAETYLNKPTILQAAKDSGATLVHPGYGFLAEDPDFAQQCEEAGLGFVGPSPAVIRLMGDKARARQAAIAANVPVVPGTNLIESHDQNLEVLAASLGFPLMIKAAAGGGGIGMRVVEHPDELHSSVESTRGLARKAFGNDSIYLERLIRDARHVEVQIFGFGDGKAVHLFERDCSLQRRHQKVIEEAPATGIPAACIERMRSVAVDLAQACHYTGAGTVEFLLDRKTHEFFFIEMNTRIQVEHPVSEMITGVDLVKAQIRQALGEDLTEELAQENISCSGYAIEARICAERPNKRFLPAVGTVTSLVLPSEPGIRIETGLREGSAITSFYDSLIMKVIAHGPSRTQAIERLKIGLSEIELTGIDTNISLLGNILKLDDFELANVDTGLLERHLDDLIQEQTIA